ncbi:MAG: tryptophan--tRNA ligase [Candidatus Colwellbacteria bacterium]|nr:tryptophan--tRNA ligase [Candidatus Colwellbacteria bacterium]
MKPVVVSGIKPSGKLHIGNLLGMTKQSIDIQSSGKYDCLYFIADYHALTQKYSPTEKSADIFSLAVDMLSLGIDPERSVFFMQSDVLEHANMAWLLNCITPAGQLQGMIEFREKVQEGQPASAGLLDYPVLMAADILSYKAEFVPVGEDQRQHLEIAREIARIFNKRFGKTFPEPKGIFVEGLRVKSLDNPAKKMSKSLPKGCLYLSDSPEVIKKKIRSAVTDSGSEIIYDPEKKPALANLLLIYSEMSGRNIKDIAEEYRSSGYASFKEDLARVISDTLSSFREKKEELSSKPKRIREILLSGAEKARLIASKNLEEAKEKMGLI